MDIGIRTARAADITAMHEIRLAVRENALRDLRKVTPESYLAFVDSNIAWVAEIGAKTIGFAAIDAPAASIQTRFNPKAAQNPFQGVALE